MYAKQARTALREVVPDLDRRERMGQIEILDGEAFDPGKALPVSELVAGLLARENEALSAGFEGLRTNGNCAWVGQSQRSEFQCYETLVQGEVHSRRMIFMCSFRPGQLQASDMVDIIDRHDLVLRYDRAGASPIKDGEIHSRRDHSIVSEPARPGALAGA